MKQLNNILKIKDNYGSSFISPLKSSDFSELADYQNDVM